MRTLEADIASLEASRRPLVSGLGEGGVGLFLLAVAGAVVVRRRHAANEGA